MTVEALNILLVTAWPPTDPAGGISTVIRTLQTERSSKADVAQNTSVEAEPEGT